MSQAIQADALAKIESVARTLKPGAADDFRLLMRDVMLANLTYLSPGGNLLQFGGAKSGGAAAPTGVTHTIEGANGQYSVAIQNPPTSQGSPIWHEISYSSLKSFTGPTTTTLEPTTATSATIAEPGGNFFFRLRSSYDKVNWSNYQLAEQSSIPANYVGAAATEPGVPLNQSNFAFVNSQPSAGVPTVSINGVGGTYSPYTAVRGGIQSLRPSATIVGTELGSTQFVGFDGSQFHLSPNLASILDDNLEPVGSVVVGSGVAGGGGANGGNGSRMTAL